MLHCTNIRLGLKGLTGTTTTPYYKYSLITEVISFILAGPWPLFTTNKDKMTTVPSLYISIKSFLIHHFSIFLWFLKMWHFLTESFQPKAAYTLAFIAAEDASYSNTLRTCLGFLGTATTKGNKPSNCSTDQEAKVSNKAVALTCVFCDNKRQFKCCFSQRKLSQKWSNL